MTREQTRDHETTDITENMKKQFDRAYRSLRNTGMKEQKLLWRRKHANERCDTCHERGCECTVSEVSSTSLACNECVKSHRVCSKALRARKEIILEKLGINDEQYDALNRWHDCNKAPKKTQGKSTDSRKKPPRKDHTDDNQDVHSDNKASEDDEGVDVEEIGKKAKRCTGRKVAASPSKTKKNTIVSKRKLDAHGALKPEAKRMKRLIESGTPEVTIKTTSTVDARTNPNGYEDRMRTAASSNVEPDNVGSPSTLTELTVTNALNVNNQIDACEPTHHVPQLRVLLRQTKRDLEEVTTSLRFKRKTKEEAADLYDQIALKLGLVMERYGVAA
ncbi:hypothetical protein L218DRAFT_717207 [Marasmius fiardii PR-910]|nr:hypothetical protein L218DRAFT_717207 [Marasmius fiardii PR-910]